MFASYRFLELSKRSSWYLLPKPFQNSKPRTYFSKSGPHFQPQFKYTNNCFLTHEPLYGFRCVLRIGLCIRLFIPYQVSFRSDSFYSLNIRAIQVVFSYLWWLAPQLCVCPFMWYVVVIVAVGHWLFRGINKIEVVLVFLLQEDPEGRIRETYRHYHWNSIVLLCWVASWLK